MKLQRLGALVLVTGIILAACSTTDATPDATTGGSGSGAAAAAADLNASWARPAILADLPTIELIGPAQLNAGPTPTFSWAAVDGAVEYRLSVLGPDGVRWAWSGAETSIAYGGEVQGVGGPQLVPGSAWSVAAFDASGMVLALSDLRAVSPTDDPGPAASWRSGAPVAAGTEPSEAPEAAEGGGPAAAGTTAACDLLSVEEIAPVLGGEWSEPESTTYPHGKGSNCEWTSLTSQYGGGVSLSVAVAEAFDPAGWNGEDDPLLDGLGDDAFLTRSGMDRRVVFVKGDVTITFAFDYGEPDAQEKFVELARIVEGRLD